MSFDDRRIRLGVMITSESEERFTALDERIWTAAYLPAWSSRASAAATWSVEPDGLHLCIPPG